MPTTVMLVLRKEYSDNDPELKTATEGWDAGGWVMAGATITQKAPSDPQTTLHGMLYAECERQRLRADKAEKTLAHVLGEKA